MEAIQIRIGTVKDVHSFYPFFKQSLHDLFPEYTPATRQYFTDIPYTKTSIVEMLRKRAVNLFLAFDHDRIIGYFLTHKTHAGVAMAIWIAVHSEFQKKGIATKLVQIWEETAVYEGAHALQLWTRDHNVPFYKNRGFTLVGKFPNAWYGVDINMLYKLIQKPEEKHFLKDYFGNIEAEEENA